MKSTFSFQPSLKQTFHFSSNARLSLELLSCSRSELMTKIAQLSSSNPFVHMTNPQRDENWMENIGESKKNLKEDLYMQLRLGNLKWDQTICGYIIESLDEHGFFTISPEQAAKDLSVLPEQVQYSLRQVQQLDPAGVAAAGFVDALCIQLERKKQNQAALLLQKCSKEIEAGEIKAILKKMDISTEQLEVLMSQIRQCDPYPCREYETSAPLGVLLPDLLIHAEDGKVVIEAAFQDNIEVSQIQSQLMDDQMKDYLRQARFFADAVNRRNKTLLMVADLIVAHQESWFLYKGEKKPFTQQELAKQSGLHVSTVSRTLKDKYFEFEKRIYPLSFLLERKTTSGTSSDEVRQAIVYYISQENKQEPYTDEELVQLMEEDEIYASRRTIAKFRKAMNIPSSRSRRIK